MPWFSILVLLIRKKWRQLELTGCELTSFFWPWSDLFTLLFLSVCPSLLLPLSTDHFWENFFKQLFIVLARELDLQDVLEQVCTFCIGPAFCCYFFILRDIMQFWHTSISDGIHEIFISIWQFVHQNLAIHLLVSLLLYTCFWEKRSEQIEGYQWTNSWLLVNKWK